MRSASRYAVPFMEEQAVWEREVYVWFFGLVDSLR
jgi:hypothetical protein